MVLGEKHGTNYLPCTSFSSPCFVYNFFRTVYYFFMGSDPSTREDFILTVYVVIDELYRQFVFMGSDPGVYSYYSNFKPPFPAARF